jgi:hypothetical protein
MTLHLTVRERLPRSRSPPALVCARSAQGSHEPNVAPIAGHEHH